ncbi:Beta-lactamase OXA-18 [Chlamydiales bacterium SCGC AB-751-O23]|jgi:beta-lactamase class D|nr:Beta-lactamase OXA-18 [Chlamydiales bacterium SCGC AB-751-O23]
MKNFFLLIGLSLFFVTPLFSSMKSFLLKESDKVIVSEGDCMSRHAPCSTFKIAISLMAYNEGILNDEGRPKLPFKEGYTDSIDSWRQSHDPRLWIKNSCVWYSQVLTQILGKEKFQDYLEKFSYGNKDSSGDKGKNNGLRRSWLSSSLEISLEEQVSFLQKLLDRKLQVSSKSYEMTKNILFVEHLENDWKLFGKTGNGSSIKQEGTEKREDLQIGWYVGWIEKDSRSIVFAYYIEDEVKEETYASRRARAQLKDRLRILVQKGV